MLATALLLVFLAIATFTDLRERLIYNGTTYAGIGIALVGSVVQWWVRGDIDESSLAHEWLAGFVSPANSFGGWAACGGIMLVCYVLLPGGVGGGDVKLLAMVGAFLGLYPGLEAMLWTLVLGGCFAVLVLVWRVGAWRLLGKLSSYLATAVRHRVPPTLDETDRRQLQVELFLAPSALVAAIIVRFRWIEWF